jgi:hypothetical protein
VVGCGKERGGIWEYEGREIDVRRRKYMFGFGVKI